MRTTRVTQRVMALIAMTAMLFASACASSEAPDRYARESPHNPARVQKRITAAIGTEIESFYEQLNAPHVRGANALEELVNAGLTRKDGRGVLTPQLAERVPSIENQLWRVHGDGRMETTWRIRDGARWHDGAPLTAEDLVFTAMVSRDPEQVRLGARAFDAIDRVEASDPRTVVVHWNRPFIQADQLFTTALAMPFPRHLLEQSYREDRASFLDHPYWLNEYVGAGPFRLREFVLGSYLTLEANEHYVGGHPKIDVIEVRFFPDQNALIANLLAGSVQLTLGQTLSFEQALQAREQWRDGTMATVDNNWVVLIPQFLNPTPTVLSDVAFRRALLQSIDRQELVDSLQGGLSPIAHAIISPNAPESTAIERRIVRYDYDPRQVEQLTRGLGLAKGGDGFLERGPGERLLVSIYATADEQNARPMFAVADHWQRAGIAVEPVAIPRQRATDREYRATFPTFSLQAQPNSADSLWRHHSAETRLPSNSFSGNNVNRYMNAEFDRLIDRYFVTIPPAERTQVLGDIAHHMTDQVTMLGLYYRVLPTMISNRLLHVSPRVDDTSQVWNPEAWDLH